MAYATEKAETSVAANAVAAAETAQAENVVDFGWEKDGRTGKQCGKTTKRKLVIWRVM